MGAENKKENNNKDLQEIGRKANKQSPDTFINTSIIKLTNSTIIGDCKVDAERDYKKLLVLGEGPFSIVYEAQNRITDIMRAMKIIEKNKKNLKDEKEIINEINILKTMDHPNIVKIFEFYSNEKNYSIIMEYCKEGKLLTEIRNLAPFNEKYTAYVMYQLFSAINYCHNMNIIHRDIKPENILIVSKNKRNNFPNVKIGDFGMSKVIQKNVLENKIVGSIYYVAPEVIQQKYNQKCDIWSCGVIMYVLLTKKPPFGGDTSEEIIEKIKKGVFDMTSPPFNKISSSAKDLLQKLLTLDIKKRISAQEALCHPWFKEQQSKQLYNEILNEKVVEKLLNNLKNYKKNSIIQETALAYLVHNFPQMKDVINSCKLFNQIDLNEDGKITEHELYKGLIKRIKSDTLEEDVRKIYKTLDMDDDGYIEYEEFVRAAVSKEKFMGDNVLRFAFRFFDKDNSGVITLKEIEDVFKKSVTDKNNVERALKKIISEVDINNDGAISFDEFTQVMKKMLE
jgi:calcium-dependent protein kinase